jgi:hypothetical protein
MKQRLVLSLLMLGAMWAVSLGMVPERQSLLAPPAFDCASPSAERTSATWETFVSHTAQGWQALWVSGSVVPRAAFGPPVSLGMDVGNSQDAEWLAERFIQDHGEMLGVAHSQWAAGTPVKVNRVWMVSFRELKGGVAVYSGRIDLRITDCGDLVAFFARTHPGLQVSTIPALTAESCLRNIAGLHPFPVSLHLEDAGLEILPWEDGASLCWKLDVDGSEPHQRWTAWVNARTGAVEAAVSRVATDEVSGQVTGNALPHYWDDPEETYPFPWEYVQVDDSWALSDSAGFWEVTVPGSAPYDIYSELSGLYVDVDWYHGPDASYDTLAPSSPHDWTWTEVQARVDERNLYHHTNVVHDFFKVLDPDFTGMDYPVPAVAQYGTNYENAFWNGYGTYYGGGWTMYRNFALFCDVIYHEYTHGVTDQIYPLGYLPYIGQSGAMNEAWSDYFACTITDEPLIGEGGLYQIPGHYMRNLDNTLCYPDDWVGEVHSDGRIIAGAFWDLRERVGAEVSDFLIHFTKYGLAEEFLLYFIDMLIVDDDDGNISNGSPHSVELYESFGIHGIGPGIVPQLQVANYYFNDDATAPSSGNDNGYWEPGETIELWVAVENEGFLYPPPAEEVTVTVESLHPEVSVTVDEVVLGELACGQTQWITAPLVFQISSSAPLAFAHLLLTLTANGGQVTVYDTLEIVLGIPQILLADDDAGAGYEAYYENAMHSSGLTYIRRNVSSGVDPDDLALHRVVVWWCGDESSQTVTADDQVLLTNYLQSGGRLLLTGQNVGEDICQSVFFQDVLGAVHTGDSLFYLILDGVEGDPLGHNQWLLLVGPTGAANQSSPSGVEAGPDAIEFFHYRDDPGHHAGAIRREDPSGYRTMYFGFGLEAIAGLGGSTPLPEFIEICLNWLDEGLWVPDGDHVETPTIWSLDPPYPNPFNPTVNVEFHVPTISQGQIAVYNVLGRQVAVIERGPWASGSRRVDWSPQSLPSGIYFLRLEAPGVQLVRKVTLLK